VSFWELTMPELMAAFEAASVVRRRAYEVATLAAWQTARLMRTDPKRRLPTLKKLFGEFGEAVDQSPDQLRGQLTALSQYYGIPMRAVAHG